MNSLNFWTLDQVLNYNNLEGINNQLTLNKFKKKQKSIFSGSLI